MRLIDADSLQRRICGAKCGCEYEDCWNEEGCVYDHFISNSHTINAVPVVRCSNCIHWVTDDFGNRVCALFDVANINGEPVSTKPDDFCIYGEKEGADNDT